MPFWGVGELGTGIGGSANAMAITQDAEAQDAQRRQAEWERDQEIRQMMGIGQERSDPFRL